MTPTNRQAQLASNRDRFLTGCRGCHVDASIARGLSALPNLNRDKPCSCHHIVKKETLCCAALLMAAYR